MKSPSLSIRARHPSSSGSPSPVIEESTLQDLQLKPILRHETNSRVRRKSPAPKSASVITEQPLIHGLLPDEILASVFLAGLPPLGWPKDLGAVREILRYRQLLSSVCKLWRAITLSSPPLWRIVVFRSAKTQSASSVSENNLKDNLIRSVLTKLDLIMIFNEVGVEPSAEIYELLRSVIRRTQSLTVWRKNSNLPLGIFPLPASPCLEEISLELHDNVSVNRKKSFIKLFDYPREANALTHFRFYGNQSRIRIPYDHDQTIKVFEYHQRSISGNLNWFVKHAKALESLTVFEGFLGDHSFESSSLTHLTFNGLFTLPDDIVERPLLGHLPNLKHLDLRGAKGGQIVTVTPVPSWAPLPCLETLVLSADGDLWLDHIMPLLEVTPRLVGLEVWGYAATQVLRYLDNDESVEMGVTTLEHFRVLRIGWDEDTVKSVKGPELIKRVGKLTSRILARRPNLRVEWHVEARSNGKPLPVYDNVPEAVFKYVITDPDSPLQPSLDTVVEALR